MKTASILVASVSVLLATPAFGQNASQSVEITAGQARLDPGEIICERVKQIGSRLISKRVCMTRLQWSEQKAADRSFTEGVQTQLGALRDGG